MPEDRAEPGSPVLKLSVAIIPSESKTPRPDPVFLVLEPFYDPVVYAGGIEYIYGRLRAERDLVVMSFRGSESTTSGVRCQDLIKAYFELVELPPFSKSTSDGIVAATKACRDRVSAHGIHPAAYTLAASVQDMQELRVALGYEQINLYGTGFGTQLALALARSQPETIRSLTLDAAVPLEGSYQQETILSVDRILKILYASCAADEKCNKVYPNLEQVFNQVVADMNAHAPRVDTTYLAEGKNYKITVNGDRLIHVVLLVLSLGSPDMIGQLPQMIFELREGKYTILASFLGGMPGFGSYLEYAAPSDSWAGMNFYCANHVRPDQKASLLATVQAQPALYNSYLTDLVATDDAQCAAWQGASAGVPASLEPLEIPTLIMAGTMDLLNPTDWSASADRLFKGAYFLQFQGTGGIFSPVWSSCMHQTMENFIGDPTVMPNDKCFQGKFPITWMTFKLN